jgi:DNA polymerase-3 subunit delta'
LPRQVVENILEKEGIQKQDASLLAAMAKGSVKRALAYHSTGALKNMAEEFEPLSSLPDYGVGQLLDLAQRWGRNRQDALGVLELMAQWYRDMMILFEGAPEDQVIHSAHIRELQKGADRIGGPNLAAILESVEDAREDIEANTNVQLTLDTLLFRVRNHTLESTKTI